MKFRNLALIMVCLAVAIAASGCMATPQKVLEQASGSPGASNLYSGSVAKDAAVRLPAGTPAPVPAGESSGTTDTKIIRTAYVTLEVGNVTASVDLLRDMAVAKGGYLSSTSISEGYNRRLTGTVVLRVPALSFDSTLAGVKGAGTVRSVSTQGEDVTEEYVDLEARKSSYQNQLAQYTEILKKAQNVSDVIVIQQQIDRVQTELNRLEGRLKYLSNRVDMATITVSLQEPEPVGGETGYNLVTTVNEGIAGFFGMVSFLIVLFFTLLPVIILAVIGYFLYRWRKGRRTQETPADAGKTEPERK